MSYARKCLLRPKFPRSNWRKSCAYVQASGRNLSGNTTLAIEYRGYSQNELYASLDHVFFKAIQTRSTLARYNDILLKLVKEGKPDILFLTATRMKQDGIEPDLSTYNSLLESLAAIHMGSECIAILNDMLLIGVLPNEISFYHTLKAHDNKSLLVFRRIIDRMEELGVSQSPLTHGLILKRLVTEDNLESALLHVFRRDEEHEAPELKLVEDIAQLASRNGYPRLAIDVIQWYENHSVRRVGIETWIHCLAASADLLWDFGTEIAWAKLSGFGFTPNQGLCLAVLNTASRKGRPELAVSVIEELGKSDAELGQQHFAPIVEAYCKAGQVKGAFVTIASLMSVHDVLPTMTTMKPILDVIGQNREDFDACWSELLDMQVEGISINISVMNTMMLASLRLGDFPRALQTYSELSNYELKPDMQTFEILLEGCLLNDALSSIQLLKTDIARLRIGGSRNLSELLILVTMRSRDDVAAFSMLERLEKQGTVPSQRLYEDLALQCIRRGDMRYEILVEDMVEIGYTPSSTLRVAIQGVNSSQSADENGRSTLPSSWKSHLDGYANPVTAFSGINEATERFIDGGGVLDSEPGSTKQHT